MEILGAVKRGHDATIGVNWDVIDYHIESFCALKRYEGRASKRRRLLCVPKDALWPDSDFMEDAPPCNTKSTCSIEIAIP